MNHNCERFLYEEYITLNDLNEENASNFLGIKHLNRKIKKKNAETNARLIIK